jgi:O-succinylbenzoate synthase
MNIDRIRIFKYSLPFLSQVIIKDKTLNTRKGYLIEISDSIGNTGWGEIAPLYGFSGETYESVLDEITKLKQTLSSKQIPQNILNMLANYSPSVRFGFETALLNTMASGKKLSLAGFLNPTANFKIKINALLDGSHDEIIDQTKRLHNQGFKTFKLKIGRNNPDNELKLIEEIVGIIKPDGYLRLDANRMLSPVISENFFEKLSALQIEYLEEPFSSTEETTDILTKHNIPIAFDESLKEIAPDELKKYNSLKAVVLKPTMLGYTKSMAYATNAISLGINPVISSSYESPVGIYILASMSAIVDNQVPAGLETLNRFDNSIFPDLDISHGHLDLQKHQNFFKQIDRSNFEEIILE